MYIYIYTSFYICICMAFIYMYMYMHLYVSICIHVSNYIMIFITFNHCLKIVNLLHATPASPTFFERCVTMRTRGTLASAVTTVQALVTSMKQLKGTYKAIQTSMKLWIVLRMIMTITSKGPMTMVLPLSITVRVWRKVLSNRNRQHRHSCRLWCLQVKIFVA